MKIMFINNVFADEVVGVVETSNSNFNSTVANVVPLLIFFVVFYFLLIRPQQKKQKEHEIEISNLKPNDKVMTSSGIFATVKKIKENNVLVIEIAKDVEIEIISSAVNLIK